ncbi:ATP-binding protein, partial [Casaltella massiliensis]|nr:ATP-binding protein [Casaltella massiliensis]
MKVYALVGESGSGKSYKALELAYEKNINYIIDDGILIFKNKIIAGISAKQASTKIQAVKRAIFHDENHRNE